MDNESLRVIYHTGSWVKNVDMTDKPSQTITTQMPYHIFIVKRKVRTKKPAKESKPVYLVPTMDEVRGIPWNGLTVASTFSGAGGSCTGYRMAGCRVVWANEFVPAAQASYKANASEHCVLDKRDIRQVQASDIFEATGLKQGQLDIFDGSPPCQAFSTAGKREQGWNEQKKYEHGAKQCNELLFFDYIRLLNDLQPRAFIAENVAGLVKGTAKGFFIEILQGLKQCGYEVKCKVLDAAFLGVPQYRKRAIFIGVRKDQGFEPVFPKPFKHTYSVADALPHLAQQPARSIFTDSKQTMISTDTPSRTITASGSTASRVLEYGGSEIRRMTIDELKSICSFPQDFVLHGSFAQQWERLGNSVPPLMMRAIATTLVEKLNETK